MAERPLLFFPKPVPLSRSGLPPGFSKLRLPTTERQGARLAPQFAALRRSFEEGTPGVSLAANGAPPERVVVMETIGGVKDFQRAVESTSLEWLGDFDADDVPPDEDFADARTPRKKLPRRVYVTIANQQTIQELLSLWQSWTKKGKDGIAYGFAPWGDLFSCLRDIRLWGPQDRLDETGALEAWRERVESGDEIVRCEIELWSRATPQQRRAAREQIEEVLQRDGGRLVTECIIEPICYHAILAELPIQSIKSIVEQRYGQLIRAEQVMFMRPCAQMVARGKPAEDARRVRQRVRGKPTGAPVVALLDGLPIENHALLQGRLVVDDPDEWGATYPVSAREHGTAMASLLVHGDLGEDGPSLPTPLYVRPVLRPGESSWQACEEFPRDVLTVDAIHQAVRRIVDPVAGGVATTVRIVNLSLGDRWYPFHGFLSPWARLLDWLAVEHGLLFVVSAGNDPARHFQIAATRERARAMDPAALQQATLETIVDEARHRAILAPAEAVNALTVGASHSDACDQEPPPSRRMLVARGDLPAPYSCVGLGYRRAIKPDVLAPGGTAWYQEPIAISPEARFEHAATRIVGLEHACPGRLAETDSVGRSAGTSNAAAICSRSLAFAYDALQQLLTEPIREQMLRGHEALLLRALAVHTADWGTGFALLNPLLQKRVGAHLVREQAARFLGYGVLRRERMLDCTEQRATMLGFGALEADRAHEFAVPVPAAVGLHIGLKRFTATLTWFSPINPRNRDYRRAALWFDLPQQVLTVKRQQGNAKAVQRGTVQHEIYEGDRASAVGDRASIHIRVNCRALAGLLPHAVPYALVCSLEVEDGVEIPVYQQIRDRLQIRVPASGS